MSPAVAIEEMTPTIEIVADAARSEDPGMPADALPGYAHFLGNLFDRIRRIEAEYLEHGPRSRQTSNQLRILFQQWTTVAKRVGDRVDWASASIRLRDDLISRIDEAEEVLADFAIGEAGANRIAERFREEAVQF